MQKKEVGGFGEELPPVERKLRECALLGSDICNFAGCEGCEECFVPTMGGGLIKEKKSVEEYNDNWQVTLSLLPDNIDELHTTDKCRFCRQEDKNPAAAYAMVDLAHPEPAHMKGMFFGFGKKVRTDMGSIVQLPITICQDCVRRRRMREAIKWLGIGIGLLLAILVLMIPGVANWMAGAFWALPLIAFVALIVAGYLVGNAVSNAYQKKAEEYTEFDALNLPIVSEMKWRGWFPIQRDRGAPHISIKRSKPRPHMRFKQGAQAVSGQEEQTPAE